jgi:hypothetical protein
MTKIPVFVQVHGRQGLIEVEVPETVTLGDLHEALKAAGIPIEDALIFVDESEEPETRPHHEHLPHMKHGCRIHVCHCKRIKTTVHFAHKTVEHEFAPGTRVRAVKALAVKKLEMDARDAAEHVLQLCGSTDRPASDTPLAQLVHHHRCEVCFDLVPDKRVEG